MATILGGPSRLNSGRPLIARAIRSRYRKSVRQRIKGEKISSNVLAIEEEKIFSNVPPFLEAFKGLLNNILRGYTPKVEADKEHKRTVLRFFKIFQR